MTDDTDLYDTIKDGLYDYCTHVKMIPEVLIAKIKLRLPRKLKKRFKNGRL